MTPFVRRVFLACWPLVVGCVERDLPPLPDAAWPKPVRLEAEPDRLAVRPGGSQQIRFRLRDEDGSPVARRPISFAIVEDRDTPGAGGAQLSFERSLTDDKGETVLEVIAGPPRAGQSAPVGFFLHAAALDASLDVVVSVSDRPHAAAEIAPVLTEAALAKDVTKIRLFFYDLTACAAVSLRKPMPPLRPVRELDPDGTEKIHSIATDGSHAVLALGLAGDGTVRAAGCVDLLGASLLSDALMRLPVPLGPLFPEPEGLHQVTSLFQFRSALRGVAGLRAAWSELGACPYDPARLWLDCTLDALDNSDPLDCRPVIGGEGSLGGALMARLGAPAGAGSRCRGPSDSHGRASLDAVLDGLFPASRPRMLAELGALPGEIETMLASLRITSWLEISRAATPGVFSVRHALAGIELPAAPVHPILSPVLLAAPVAAVDGIRATTGLDQLEIGSHAFTLRLGTAARHTFALSSLRPRCVPADVRDVRGFVLTLVNLAARSGNRGCSGLDALLCDDVGWSRGCVMGACVRGLDALIGGLESAFDELEGSDFDFALLTGSAPLVDRDGDGIADALGSEATATGPPSAPGGPGLWSGQLRARAGSDTIYGSWTAERAP